MLDLPGDTASDIQFRTHRDTGLTDLTVVVAETGIDSRTAGTYLGVKLFRQIEQ